VRRHDRLRCFAASEIGAKPDAAPAAPIGDFQGQRVAGVIVPDLHRVDAVPVRALASREKEKDRGGSCATAAIKARVAKCLAIVAAFRVRLQIEPRDYVLSGGKFGHQDLFLRSRSSAKISTAL
jgi:hypothetical protein